MQKGMLISATVFLTTLAFTAISTLTAADPPEDIIIKSEGYKSKTSAQNGIESRALTHKYLWELDRPLEWTPRTVFSPRQPCSWLRSSRRY